MNYKSCSEFEFLAVDLYSLKPSALSEGLTFSLQKLQTNLMMPSSIGSIPNVALLQNPDELLAFFKIERLSILPRKPESLN